MALKPREQIDLLFYQLQETARRVANLQLECKVVNTSNSSYMANACPRFLFPFFGQICELVVLRIYRICVLKSDVLLLTDNGRSKLTWKALRILSDLT